MKTLIQVAACTLSFAALNISNAQATDAKNGQAVFSRCAACHNYAKGGANGLGPTVQNLAVGFTVTFPVLDLPALRAREAAQSATIRSQSARSEQLAVELRAQWNRAVAMLNGSRRIAANTPVQVEAARTAVQQANARYEAGLANIAEAADAQRLLTQAEIDNVLARLSVWRGLLGIATAAGDLQPFIAEASR